MEKTRTGFDKVLAQVDRRMKKAQEALSLTQALAKVNRMDMAYTAAFDLAHEAEKITLLTRVLPAYTGHPRAQARRQTFPRTA